MSLCEADLATVIVDYLQGSMASQGLCPDAVWLPIVTLLPLRYQWSVNTRLWCLACADVSVLWVPKEPLWACDDYSGFARNQGNDLYACPCHPGDEGHSMRAADPPLRSIALKTVCTGRGLFTHLIAFIRPTWNLPQNKYNVNYPGDTIHFHDFCTCLGAWFCDNVRRRVN